MRAALTQAAACVASLRLLTPPHCTIAPNPPPPPPGHGPDHAQVLQFGRRRQGPRPRGRRSARGRAARAQSGAGGAPRGRGAGAAGTQRAGGRRWGRRRSAPGFRRARPSARATALTRRPRAASLSPGGAGGRPSGAAGGAGGGGHRGAVPVGPGVRHQHAGGTRFGGRGAPDGARGAPDGEARCGRRRLARLLSTLGRAPLWPPAACLYRSQPSPLTPAGAAGGAGRPGRVPAAQHGGQAGVLALRHAEGAAALGGRPARRWPRFHAARRPDYTARAPRPSRRPRAPALCSALPSQVQCRKRKRRAEDDPIPAHVNLMHRELKCGTGGQGGAAAGAVGAAWLQEVPSGAPCLSCTEPPRPFLTPFPRPPPLSLPQGGRGRRAGGAGAPRRMRARGPRRLVERAPPTPPIACAAPPPVGARRGPAPRAPAAAPAAASARRSPAPVVALARSRARGDMLFCLHAAGGVGMGGRAGVGRQKGRRRVARAGLWGSAAARTARRGRLFGAGSPSLGGGCWGWVKTRGERGSCGGRGTTDGQRRERVQRREGNAAPRLRWPPPRAPWAAQEGRGRGAGAALDGGRGRGGGGGSGGGSAASRGPPPGPPPLPLPAGPRRRRRIYSCCGARRPARRAGRRPGRGGAAAAGRRAALTARRPWSAPPPPPRGRGRPRPWGGPCS
jgi:hypothetical protein